MVISRVCDDRDPYNVQSCGPARHRTRQAVSQSAQLSVLPQTASPPPGLDSLEMKTIPVLKCLIGIFPSQVIPCVSPCPQTPGWVHFKPSVLSAAILSRLVFLFYFLDRFDTPPPPPRLPSPSKPTGRQGRMWPWAHSLFEPCEPSPELCPPCHVSRGGHVNNSPRCGTHPPMWPRVALIYQKYQSAIHTHCNLSPESHAQHSSAPTSPSPPPPTVASSASPMKLKSSSVGRRYF